MIPDKERVDSDSGIAPEPGALPQAAEVESDAGEAAEAAPIAADEPAAPALPWVRRHHWIVRLTHWINTVVLVGMVASGLQIYGAYERFGIRGTKLPLPNPMDQGYPWFGGL